MYDFKFFEPYELQGKTNQELHRFKLIDRAMVLDHEYDDLIGLTTDQLEAMLAPKKPEPTATKAEKPKRATKPRRIIPRILAEAFEYREGRIYRVEYIEHEGERFPNVSPHPVDGTMRAQGLVINWRGQHILLHRLVWFLVRGAWPDGRLIHLDGDKTNNEIENLELEHRVKIHQTKAGFVVKVRDGVLLRELGVYEKRIDAVATVDFYRSINPLG